MLSCEDTREILEGARVCESFYVTSVSTFSCSQNSPFFDAFDIDVNSGILGDGSFSICRRCVEKATGKEYAVKIVSRKIDSAREISLLRLCQGHPNIVNLYNVYHDEVRTENFDATEELRGSRTGLITILLLFTGAHIHSSRASQRR